MMYDRPDRNLTRGVAGPFVVARHVTFATKQRVFKAYRIPLLRRPLYTIDHLIPLELCGTNDLANLWPQPRAEAKLKDRDEDRLALAVKQGQLTYLAAQREILALWGP